MKIPARRENDFSRIEKKVLEFILERTLSRRHLHLIETNANKFRAVSAMGSMGLLNRFIKYTTFNELASK